MRAENKYFYIGLIFLVWLITYLLYTFLWEQRLGWDEVSYLATARGIAENLDFSSRFNTVMGLIKCPFPQHTHHYPIYSLYLAIFFKLFGVSLHVAYFSTWLAALVACIFIYLTMLLLTENDRLFSFFTGISFLFLPRILDYCDTAIMEIPGCALISIFIYFIFKGIVKGKLNPLLMGIAGIWLYLFKSLFIGVLIGFFVLMVLVYRGKFTELKIQTKLPLSLGLLIYLGSIFIIYVIFTKFIFLPLAPMMNFSKEQEELGVYADFAGGFFQDPLGNIIKNLKGSFENVVLHYYPNFPVLLIEGEEGFYGFGPPWCDFGLFLLVLFYVAAFLFFFWKKLLPSNRFFILFSLFSILVFNLVFNLVALTNIGQRCRYNVLYIPLLLISACLLIRQANFIKKKEGVFIFLSLLVLVYIPFFIAEIKTEEWTKNTYYNMAHKESEIVKKFIGNSKPAFIYFNTGTHTSWDSFPVRVIVQEASNDELKQINLKLSKPVEYLFLRQENKLFKQNKDLILKGNPIIDDWYTFYGADPIGRVIVYKLGMQFYGK